MTKETNITKMTKSMLMTESMLLKLLIRELLDALIVSEFIMRRSGSWKWCSQSSGRCKERREQIVAVTASLILREE